MEIKKCRVHELTFEQRTKCARLSFREDGDLQEWIRTYPDAEVVTAWDGDRLLGWGMRLLSGDSGYYVRKSERRKGIGSKIYYTLNPPRKRVIVHPHDTNSAAFFYSLRKIKKDDVEWYSRKTVDELGVKRKSRRMVMAQEFTRQAKVPVEQSSN